MSEKLSFDASFEIRAKSFPKQNFVKIEPNKVQKLSWKDTLEKIVSIVLCTLALGVMGGGILSLVTAIPFVAAAASVTALVIALQAINYYNEYRQIHNSEKYYSTFDADLLNF